MLQTVEFMGRTVYLYDFWNDVSAYAMVLFILLQLKRFCAISPLAARQSSAVTRLLIALCQMLGIIVVVYYLLNYFNRAFGDWFTEGTANYYGSLTAWFLGVSSMTLLFRTSLLHTHDLLAPALPLQLAFSKMGCFSYGCCSGFAMPNSWYFNQDTNRAEFPVQLVEALVALALFFVLLWYRKRSRQAGSVFPLYLLLYSASRFLTEFLRADFPNVLGPFDAYQFLSIAFFVIGIVLLCVVRVYEPIEQNLEAKWALSYETRKHTQAQKRKQAQLQKYEQLQKQAQIRRGSSSKHKKKKR
ncbi:MAG: prolipoprotein diacylglyceryl transferase [Oscillospiraceae bacterium]|nr:prolipoprotein diacylglyceryl transferase [Oscillospiraceae bacterium]